MKVLALDDIKLVYHSKLFASLEEFLSEKHLSFQVGLFPVTMSVGQKNARITHGNKQVKSELKKLGYKVSLSKVSIDATLG